MVSFFVKEERENKRGLIWSVQKMRKKGEGVSPFLPVNRGRKEWGEEMTIGSHIEKRGMRSPNCDRKKGLPSRRRRKNEKKPSTPLLLPRKVSFLKEIPGEIPEPPSAGGGESPWIPPEAVSHLRNQKIPYTREKGPNAGPSIDLPWRYGGGEKNRIPARGKKGETHKLLGPTTKGECFGT